MSVASQLQIVMCVNNDMMHDARVEREAGSLVGAGYAVTILCRRRDNQQAQDEERRGFHIHRVQLLTAGLPKHPLFWWLKLLEFMFRTFWRGWRLDADVYHAHDLDMVPAMYLAARLRGARVIYDAHELWTERSYTLLAGPWRRLERWLLPRVNAVIAANLERATIMRDEYGAPRLPVVLENCPPYANVEHTSLLTDFVREAGRNWNAIILYQGGIIPGRSAEIAIDALPTIPSHAGLVFLGRVDEAYQKLLLRHAENFGVADRVLFHPPVPYRELLPYTASATVGLVLYENTSRNNYLCASNKLYEYMMVGLPVVASNFPPITRVLTQAHIGKLVDPKDSFALANAITDLLDKPYQLLEMSKAARALSQTEYNWEVQSGKLLAMYSTLVHHRLDDR